jgi:hypothetical protein
MNMRLRMTTTSPLLRLLAGLALAVFVVAQIMCFVHCHLGGGHEDKTRPSCHGSVQTAASHHSHDHSQPAAPSASATCSTLKTMLVTDGTPLTTTPPSNTLYLLSPFALILDTTETQPEGACTRQAHSREWTFTPAVCLGPAFRSLAPPSLG